MFNTNISIFLLLNIPLLEKILLLGDVILLNCLALLLREDLSKILSDINTMKEKINKLEKENNDMKELLYQEKEKGDNNNTLKQEINDLKKIQAQFEASILKEFSNFKNEMINDINAKLFKLFHNLKEKFYTSGCLYLFILLKKYIILLCVFFSKQIEVKIYEEKSNLSLV